MDRFNALGRGLQLMLVAGVLLLLDSLIFNWQEVDVGLPGVEDVGQNAWHGFWGVVMGLLTIVLVAWIIARLADIDIPLPVSTALIAAVLAVLIFLFTLIKVLTDDFVTFWAWLGLILAALILVGAWLVVQGAGGLDALRAEIPMGSSTARTTTGTTAGTTATTPPTTTEAPTTPTAPPPSAAAEPPTAPTTPTEPAAPFEDERYEPPEETIQRDRE